MLLLTEGREETELRWLALDWMCQPGTPGASRAKIKAFPVTAQAAKLVGEGRWVSLHTHCPPCTAKITATLLLAKSNPHPLSNQHSVGKSSAVREDYMTN